jgi:hypothetical protein
VIDWLVRMLRRRDPRDAELDTMMREHARVMKLAEKTMPDDPVIQALREQADSWVGRSAYERAEEDRRA